MAYLRQRWKRVCLRSISDSQTPIVCFRIYLGGFVMSATYGPPITKMPNQVYKNDEIYTPTVKAGNRYLVRIT